MSIQYTVEDTLIILRAISNGSAATIQSMLDGDHDDAIRFDTRITNQAIDREYFEQNDCGYCGTSQDPNDICYTCFNNL